VAAERDLLREQSLAGSAVGIAFAGERRLGFLGECGGGCQMAIHHLLPVLIPSDNGAGQDGLQQNRGRLRLDWRMSAASAFDEVIGFIRGPVEVRFEFRGGAAQTCHDIAVPLEALPRRGRGRECGAGHPPHHQWNWAGFV
jgi:hypothetical protein